MADLTKWVDPVNLGRFRLGLRRPGAVDYTTWSDDELIERVREFLPRLVVTWRAGDDLGDEYLLVRSLQVCPDLIKNLLSDQEAHDLGV